MREIPLRYMDTIDDQKVKEFTIAGTCFLYRYFVWKTYGKTLHIDLSKLTPGEALQYEGILNACRRIQSILDLKGDTASALTALRSAGHDSAFVMRLPGASVSQF